MADVTRIPDDEAPTASAGGGLPDKTIEKLRLKIPGYKLQSEISRGGQAVVYKAIQESTGRPVAIKVLREGPLADPAARERMQREVRVLATLNHPNVVTVLDCSQTADGHDYFVMNFISGRSLDEFMKEGSDRADSPLPQSLLQLFMKICDAVNAAHLRGITHRDLSPSNILIDERGEPQVVDFGLARTAFDRFVTTAQKDVSITGQFLGKLAYASPEQARGDPDKIDIRTDVYALGVILYQILTAGRFPYEVVGNIAEVLNNIIYTRPTPPSKLLSSAEASKAHARQRIKKQHPPAVNETIETIVLKALEKNPDDRYQSAGDLCRDVRSYLEGKPTIAVAAGREPAVRLGMVGPFTVLPKSWMRVAMLALVSAAATAAICGTAYVLRYEMVMHEIQERMHSNR
jgi:serine/threonine protein kinase